MLRLADLARSLFNGEREAGTDGRLRLTGWERRTRTGHVSHRLLAAFMPLPRVPIWQSASVRLDLSLHSSVECGITGLELTESI